MVIRVSLHEALASIRKSVESLTHTPEVTEEEHEKVIKRPEPHTCNKCQVRFDTLAEFKSHWRSPEHIFQLKKTEEALQVQEETRGHRDTDDRLKLQRVPPYFRLSRDGATFSIFQEILNDSHAINDIPALLRELDTLLHSSVLFCLIRNGYVAISLLEVGSLKIVKSKCLKK